MDSVESTLFSKTFATWCQLQFHHYLNLQPSKPVQLCFQFPEVMEKTVSDPVLKSCFWYLAPLTMDTVMRQKNKASHSERNIWGACLINASTESIKEPEPSEKAQMWYDIIVLEKSGRCFLFSLQSTRKRICRSSLTVVYMLLSPS